MDPEKIAKMVTLSLPTNIKELRSRLGLFSYYQQYIKGFSDITRPMYELTKEEDGKLVLFEWMLTRQKAFEIIKVRLAMSPMIAHSDFDKPFILYMNISNGDVRVILHQKGNDERKQIITYISRIFNEHEKKYLIIK